MADIFDPTPASFTQARQTPGEKSMLVVVTTLLSGSSAVFIGSIQLVTGFYAPFLFYVVYYMMLGVLNCVFGFLSNIASFSIYTAKSYANNLGLASNFVILAIGCLSLPLGIASISLSLISILAIGFYRF